MSWDPNAAIRPDQSNDFEVPTAQGVSRTINFIKVKLDTLAEELTPCEPRPQSISLGRTFAVVSAGTPGHPNAVDSGTTEDKINKLNKIIFKLQVLDHMLINFTKGFERELEAEITPVNETRKKLLLVAGNWLMRLELMLKYQK